MNGELKEVIDAARAAIKEYNMIEEGDAVVVGFSGGPDSTCLLDILCDYARKVRFSIFPVHINHMLRGNAADEDQKFCVEFCAERGLECACVREDCRKLASDMGVGIEEAGRIIRYRAFAETAAEAERAVPGRRAKIALAQHRDDRVETVLMRMIRGTGVDGLSGIDYVRNDEEGRCVIRPLLDISKAQINEYCRLRRLEPRVDDTNFEPSFIRNKIRLQLLPELETQYNSSIRDALTRLAISAGEDKEYLGAAAYGAYEKALKTDAGADNDRIVLDGDMLRELHPAVARRVLSIALKKLGLTEDMAFSHFRKALEIISSGSPSAEAEFPHGYFVRNVYGDVAVGRKHDPEASGFSIKTRVVSADDPGALEATLAESRTRCVLFDFDALKREFGDDVRERIKVRSREPGDTVKTAAGTKKIQNIFVDLKVPKDMREDIPVIAVGSSVIAVVFPEKVLRATTGVRRVYGSVFTIFKITSEVGSVLAANIETDAG